MAVLKLLSVLLLSNKKPTAILNVPVVTLKRAACPSGVLLPEQAPSGGGEDRLGDCRQREAGK
jgi:hypothetical protein